MSPAAADRSWCNMCSTSPIRRSNSKSWPDQNRDSRVVFITRNMRERAVRDLFAAVAALAEE